jgi:hypothetical protein
MMAHVFGLGQLPNLTWVIVERVPERTAEPDELP